MFMDLRELNKIKLQLTVSLLERLEQLKKAMDDITDLQKILSEKESEITSLQSLSTQDKEATLTLKVRIRQLKLGSKRNEREIKATRRGPSKGDLYRELFEENKGLCFEVNTLHPLDRYRQRGSDRSRKC